MASNIFSNSRVQKLQFLDYLWTIIDQWFFVINGLATRMCAWVCHLHVYSIQNRSLNRATCYPLSDIPYPLSRIDWDKIKECWGFSICVIESVSPSVSPWVREFSIPWAAYAAKNSFLKRNSWWRRHTYKKLLTLIHKKMLLLAHANHMMISKIWIIIGHQKMSTLYSKALWEHIEITLTLRVRFSFELPINLVLLPDGSTGVKIFGLKIFHFEPIFYQ